MIDITITKLDRKYFPIECCGTSYSNSKTFMDHFLPTHQVETK